MRLGERFRSARARAGMTQQQACDFMGMERSQLCDLERAKVDVGVHLKTLLKMGKCYGCSLDELTGHAPPKLPEVNARELRAVNLLLSVMRGGL